MAIMGKCLAGHKFDTGVELDDPAMSVSFEAWCEGCCRNHTGHIKAGRAVLGPLPRDDADEIPSAPPAPAPRARAAKPAPRARATKPAPRRRKR